jgi:predicted glycosyltransferase
MGLRILFSVRKPSNVRHYEPVLRALAARGHEVELVREHLGDFDWPPFVLALADACPRIRLGTMPTAAKTHWWELATRFRRARFYLRFFGPAYRNTPALLARARKRAPRPAVRIAEIFGERGRRFLVGLLDMLEQSTRSAAIYHDYLREHRPDVVVLTPLVVLKTAQLDLARAAMELGIRNIFAVASWDHLSSKGELNFSPQQVMVWNEVQKREAIELHGLEPSSIVVTGSQVFDDWFDRHPSATREAFCERVGLRPDRPIVLYVCSSLLEGSPPERTFVVEWVKQLRKSQHQVLRECGILVRPHHEHGEGWRRVSFEEYDNVACWPRAGDLPIDARSKSDYFDSLYHASATVGLNTSAMIEAAILGHPVYTILMPEFADSQEGTVHFHYLLQGPESLLRSTRSLGEHARDLAARLEGHDPDPERSARFVRAFVRPRGLETPATTVFVEELEALAARPAPARLPVPLWTHLIRPILKPFADAAARRILLMEEASRRRAAERLEEHRRQKLPQLLEYRQKKAEETRRRKQELAGAMSNPEDTP